MQTNGTKIEKKEKKTYEWEECWVLYGYGLCLLLPSHVLCVVLCCVHSTDLTLIVLVHMYDTFSKILVLEWMIFLVLALHDTVMVCCTQYVNPSMSP